jgi:hypothetical protein
MHPVTLYPGQGMIFFWGIPFLVRTFGNGGLGEESDRGSACCELSASSRRGQDYKKRKKMMGGELPCEGRQKTSGAQSGGLVSGQGAAAGQGTEARHRVPPRPMETTSPMCAALFPVGSPSRVVSRERLALLCGCKCRLENLSNLARQSPYYEDIFVVTPQIIRDFLKKLGDFKFSRIGVQLIYLPPQFH